ncbi:MAG: hypothetical protein HFE48_02855 [Clostridia bacterium]|nr:hypothetical protein [Clostridia bacterium]
MKCFKCGKEITPDTAYKCSACGNDYCPECAEKECLCDCLGSLNMYS